MKRKWTICPVCDGEGSYVNPSIDANGLSSEDFHEDPDFAENYFSGAYDITCHACDGAGKMLEEQADELADRRADDIADRRLRAMESGDAEAYHSAADRRWDY